MKQRHYLDCLALRSTGASERVAWQTCWRRTEDLKLGTFKPWFSASFCVALWCKICNDVQTASVRLLYRSSSYHYVPSLQSLLCGCCWRCLFRFFGEVSSLEGGDPWGFAFCFWGFVVVLGFTPFVLLLQVIWVPLCFIVEPEEAVLGFDMMFMVSCTFWSRWDDPLASWGENSFSVILYWFQLVIRII